MQLKFDELDSIFPRFLGSRATCWDLFFQLFLEQRLKNLTPPGFLASLPTLPRAAEVFVNKCHSLTKADLHHLIWFCPKLTRYRNFSAPTNDPAIAIDPHSVGTPILHKIAVFAVTSGLARAV